MQLFLSLSNPLITFSAGSVALSLPNFPSFILNALKENESTSNLSAPERTRKQKEGKWAMHLYYTSIHKHVFISSVYACQPWYAIPSALVIGYIKHISVCSWLVYKMNRSAIQDSHKTDGCAKGETELIKEGADWWRQGSVTKAAWCDMINPLDVYRPIHYP